MRPIEVSEIKHIADYEILRPEWRPKMMALKDRRRIRVGDNLTFLFENRDTVRYQIQEMMRIERLQNPHEIAHEVATYNDLIPATGELSACLLIEYETPAERDVWLHNLLGLEHHIWLETGGQRSLTIARFPPIASVPCSTSNSNSLLSRWRRFLTGPGLL